MNAAIRPKVFLSAGRTETTAQDAFVVSVTQCLQDEGFEVIRAQWSSEQPLKPIWRKMQECAGTAVIAFERMHFAEGVEFRGSPKQKPLEDVSVPTIWNQIEAAMAYTLGHPLLMVVQDGLREDGLLEGRYDWYVLRVPLEPTALSQREFRGVLLDWKGRVLEAQGHLLTRSTQSHASPEATLNPEALTMGQLVGALKPAQLWAIVATLVTALAAVFSAGLALGHWTQPR
jgi:hypothetical protein